MKGKVFIALTTSIVCLCSTGVISNAQEVENKVATPTTVENKVDTSTPIEEKSEKIFNNDTLRKRVVYALNDKDSRIPGSEWEKKDAKTYNPTIEDMKLLKRVYIRGGSDETVDNIEGLKYAENLEDFNVRAMNINDYSDLQNLKKLKKFSAIYTNIKDLGQIGKITTIEELRLSNDNIEDISQLSSLVNLNKLVLNENNISDISGLSNLTNLKDLELASNNIDALYGFDENYKKVYLLEKLTKLERIDLSDNALRDDDGLQYLTNLKILHLSQNRELKEIRHLKNLKNLEMLEAIETQLNDLQPIANLTNLRFLTVRGNDIKDVTPLENLTNLEYLHIYDNKVKDIRPLKKLTKLREFNFSKNLVSDLEPLKDMDNLKVLFGYQNNVENLAPLNNLEKLRIVNLAQNNITDVSTIKAKIDDDLNIAVDREIVNKHIGNEDVQISEKDGKVIIKMKNPIKGVNGEYLELDNTKKLDLLTDYNDDILDLKNKQINNYNNNIENQVNDGTLVKTIKTNVDNDTIEFKIDKDKFNYGSENRLKVYYLKPNIIKGERWEDDFVDFSDKIINGEQVADTYKSGKSETKLYNFGGTIKLYLNHENKDVPTNKEPEISSNDKVDFNDIKGHWAEKTINSFVDKSFINGYEDKTFKPDNNMTRAEFVRVVNNVFGYDQKGTEKFDDVNENDWFYSDICIGINQGYIKGKSKENFAPNDNITRQEVAMILTNIINNKDNNVDKLNSFKDGHQTDEWAKSSVEGAIESGYLNGYEDKTIRAKGNITRAEAISMLSRVK